MSTPDLSGCTLLLVDDEEANLDLLEGILGGSGFGRLIRTQSPYAAVELARQHRPDLVLLDLHMPGMTGFDVLRELREMSPGDDYRPVLVLTADVTPEARDRALGEGARDFLTKPFDVVEVLLRVQNLLETRRLYTLQRAAREAAEAATLRAALLAEASHVLGASLDGATALAQLARILVPRLGDLCLIQLVEGDSARIAALAHADPVAEQRLWEMAEAGASVAPLARRTRPLCLPRLPARLSSAVYAFREGDPRPTALLSAPLRSGGETFGALSIVSCDPARTYVRDDQAFVEELAGRAALALENARLFADARRATAARERVLGIVAHDLRNPLASIAMGAEMALHLMPPRGAGHARETLASIQQTAAQMHRLVDDLLDVSRLEATDARIHPVEMDVADLFDDAGTMLRPLAAGRGLGLSFDAPADLRVRADGARVIQVLSNLVGNAIKFTPSGGSIAVSARVEGGSVRVSVADTGPGIPADHLPHLFGAFWQADPADRRGAGLGLSIASALVAAHGGRTWVDSVLGVGTTFHFTLPAAAESPDLVVERVPVQPIEIVVDAEPVR